MEQPHWLMDLAARALANGDQAVTLAQELTAEVERLRAQLVAAELLRAAAAQVLAALPTSPDFHARLVALSSAKRAMERGEGAELHKALLVAARRLIDLDEQLVRDDARRFFAIYAPERYALGEAADQLRAAGFTAPPPPATPATE